MANVVVRNVPYQLTDIRGKCVLAEQSSTLYSSWGLKGGQYWRTEKECLAGFQTGTGRILSKNQKQQWMKNHIGEDRRSGEKRDGG